jgi:activator of HSP90 ATPase
MSKTIVQKVLFKNTTPKVLYSLYMDAKKHSLTAGSPCTITIGIGDKYAVHNGYISGKNLELVKDKLIVQTWRAMDWAKSDVDSIFTISLEPNGNDVMLYATHTNVPESKAASIAKGWVGHYWKPWKQYIAGKAIKRPVMS